MKIIKPIQAVTLDIAGEAQKQGLYGADLSQDQADAGFGNFMSDTLQALLLVGALVCFVFIVLGAIDWITAGGDSGKIEKARGRITNSIVGLLILAASTAIMSLVFSFLGIEGINFI